MNMSVPVRRLASRCTYSYALPLRTIQPIQHQRRPTSSKQPPDGDDTYNPILAEYRRKNPDRGDSAKASQQRQTMPSQGDIATSSIFEDDRRATQQLISRSDPESLEADGQTTIGGIPRDLSTILRVTQPDPAGRERWLRRKVIQLVRKGGRLNTQEFLKRTEREHLVKSHNMKTSVKKLGMLARQIAGKTIDDAITQMRFSNKKVAQEVLKQLEAARDEAIVMRGMGLPLRPATKAAEESAETLNASTSDITGTSNSNLETAIRSTETPVEIQLKTGKRYKVTSPTNIYIDQAWVGRGPYGELPDYRARGRVFIMRTPWTSLSLVLKEEVTRIREHGEREAKRKRNVNEKVWVHLPDRPIQTHRQWYSW